MRLAAMETLPTSASAAPVACRQGSTLLLSNHVPIGVRLDSYFVSGPFELRLHSLSASRHTVLYPSWDGLPDEIHACSDSKQGLD